MQLDETELSQHLNAFEKRQQLFISQRLEYHAKSTNEKIEAHAKSTNEKIEAHAKSTDEKIEAHAKSTDEKIDDTHNKLSGEVQSVRAASETAHKEIIARLEHIESLLD